MTDASPKLSPYDADPVRAIFSTIKTFKRFDLLPVLADALQEYGADESVCNSLRETRPGPDGIPYPSSSACALYESILNSKRKPEEITQPVKVVTDRGYELRFSESDLVNSDDWDPTADGKPGRYGYRPFLIHESGFTRAVVFAQNEGDALDYAVDADKLDAYLISPEDMDDYGPEGEGITFLGNASEPFDIESLDIVELPNPSRSICSQFVASGIAVWAFSG